jgi:uncharacterized protein (TIGR00369 family)
MKMMDQITKFISGEVPQPPVGQLIGFKLVSAKPGEAVVELDADNRHANPMGTAHGGILCDIADAAMGIAYASLLEDDESFTTLELKINFLKPIWNAHLRAIGVVVKKGKTVGLTECTILDEKNSLVARASSTCMTLRDHQAKGR